MDIGQSQDLQHATSEIEGIIQSYSLSKLMWQNGLQNKHVKVFEILKLVKYTVKIVEF